MGFLTWLTGRGPGAATGPAPTPAPPDASVPDASDPAASALDVSVSGASAAGAQAWHELPPVQRTVGAAPVMADPDQFRASLGTWRNASLTAPLGHFISADAPSGIGHGLTDPAEPATPVTAAASATSALPVRGFAAPPASAVGPAVPVQRVATEPLTSARPLQPALVRELPSLPAPLPAPATDPGPGPARLAPPADAARHLSAQRSVGATGQQAGASQAFGPRGLGLGPPLSGLPPTAQRKPAASTGAAPVPLPAPTPPSEASGVKEATGVLSATGASGAACASGDAAAGGPVVARSTEPGPIPAQPIEPPPPPAEHPDSPDKLVPSSGEPILPPGEMDLAATDEPPSRPLLGADPLVARTADETGPPQPEQKPEQQPARSPIVARVAEPGQRPGAGSAPGDDGPGDAGWAVQRSPVPVRPASADGAPLPAAEPALWAGPMAPLVAQRSLPLFSGAVPETVSAASAGTGDRPVPIHWDAPADPPGASGSTAVRGAAAVQRWSGPAVASPTSSRSGGGLGRERQWPSAGSLPGPSPGLSVQRAAGRPSAAGSPRRPGSSPLLDAGAVAVSAGVAQRMVDGSVVFRPPAGPSASGAVGWPATVQRETETADPPPPDLPLDPGLEPADEPEPEPAAEPAADSGAADGGDPAGGAGEGGGQGAPGGRGGAPAVTDELVRALFAPLSRLLKAELRLERERAGYLIDTRH
ncbi:hypothetical protein [Streptomyces zagrosensis]|uniref:Uncharacterized protein n=1 Tax=Streptomyces zagrosensis TaxID=1042984 RepID=A0A7W9V0A2_9ACTN|nr:hypothetical protein [Streptomyces zagrosensis]MBB5936599.1 hypothetical protein [Streptomyces zagrosensis]